MIEYYQLPLTGAGSYDIITSYHKTIKKASSLSTVRDRKSGFTIVELLIAIVVIGILATISIVAYNGVSNNTHDTAVKSDLANFAKKIRLYHAEKGEYPLIGELSAISSPVSQKSYDTSVYNFYYCVDKVLQDKFDVHARSKSGKLFYDSSKGSGVSVYGSPYGGMCSIIGLDREDLNAVSRGYGYDLSSGQWRAWLK